MKLCFAAAAIIIAVTLPALAGPKEELMAVDRAFAKMSVQQGYDQAYIANLAEDGQTFTGQTPIRNKADAVTRLNDPKAPHSDPKIKITWAPDTGGVSADGTLGWTEGRHSHTGPGVRTTGHYMTIWVREKGVWKCAPTSAPPIQSRKPAAYLPAGFSARMAIWLCAACSVGSAVEPAGNWLKDRI